MSTTNITETTKSFIFDNETFQKLGAIDNTLSPSCPRGTGSTESHEAPLHCTSRSILPAIILIPLSTSIPGITVLPHGKHHVLFPILTSCAHSRHHDPCPRPPHRPWRLFADYMAQIRGLDVSLKNSPRRVDIQESF